MPVSLVMIVRNEERCIGRALESVKPYVDEMIVVDTGSTDNTINIAKSYNAKVFHFKWIDDFSAARNFALEKASCEWRLIIDADEYLISGGDELHQITQISPEEPAGKLLLIHNQREKTSSAAALPRLLSQDVRYSGIVHEQPNLLLSACEKTKITLMHDGYLKINRAHKQNRNILLLKKALKALDDPYYHFQLGTEYLLNETWDLCQEQLELALPNILNFDPCISTDFARKYLHCLTVRKKFELGNEFINNHKSQFLQNPGFLYAIGVFLVGYADQNPEKLDDLIPRIEAQWIETMNLSFQMVKNKQWTFGMSPADCFRLSAQNLISQYEILGEVKKATHCKSMLNLAQQHNDFCLSN